MPSPSSVVLALVVLPGVFAVAGCSDGNKAFVLKGSVSYQGKALSTGMVRIHMDKDRMAMAMLRSDGSFEATDVFPGQAKVTIEEDPSARTKRMGRPVGAAAPPSAVPDKSASPPVAIPAKYTDVKTTPLTYTLKAGTALKIELE